MNVLVTGPSPSSGSTGGIKTHVQNFRSSFSNQSQIKINIFPVTFGYYDQESFISKINRIIRLIIPFFSAAKNSNLIHLNSTFDDRSILREGLLIFIASKLLQKKIILQFHGGRAHSIKLMQLNLSKKIFTWLWKDASAILVLSRKQKKLMERMIPKLKCRVVANFIDTNRVYKSANRKVGETVNFLFLGRLDKAKGIREIFEAADILIAKYNNFRITFCGDGPMSLWLQKKLQSEAFAGRIFYNGFVDGNRKKQNLAQADVFLLPSYSEGFPYSLLEAMKYSLPIISTPTGAITDIIQPGKNGFFVPPKDGISLSKKMMLFCKTPALVQEMGIASREQVEEKYSFEVMRKTFQKLYRQAVENT